MSISQPRPFHPWKTLLVASVLIAFFVYTYFIREVPGPAHPGWQGRTMGTVYAVRLADSPLSQTEIKNLRRSIQGRLDELNRQMSTWLEDSEISRFNRQSADQAIAISPSFATVLKASISLHRRTAGAFDPTIRPLIALWGFGSDAEARPTPPSDSDIRAVQEKIGVDKLVLNADAQTLAKQAGDVQINLDAIAKGRGVDEVAELVKAAGVSNYFVEIGGEVAVQGVNAEGIPWRIGIEKPVRSEGNTRTLYGIINLTNGAVATSGDYRNYLPGPDGTLLPHILDPRSGRPIASSVASVSVIADNCMMADGLATALMVMPLEEGRRWVETQTDTEALWMVRESPDAPIVTHTSSGFRQRTNWEPISEQ